MAILILTRHAKSDWSMQDLSDHARALNPRGIAAAPMIGKALTERGFVPDQILCSTATRAQQTWAGLASAMPETPEPEVIHRLYHATPDTMLQELQKATGDVVAMVAHNPGIAALADALVSNPPNHPRFVHFPTGATLIAEVDDWASLALGGARAVDFFVPRELPSSTTA